jgi:hypothetical protein
MTSAGDRLFRRENYRSVSYLIISNGWQNGDYVATGTLTIKNINRQIQLPFHAEKAATAIAAGQLCYEPERLWVGGSAPFQMI